MATQKTSAPIQSISEPVRDAQQTSSVEPSPVQTEEPKIINTFYDAIGLSYCSKCGEAKRTDSNGIVFCPASRANCFGLLI